MVVFSVIMLVVVRPTVFRLEKLVVLLAVAFVERIRMPMLLTVILLAQLVAHMLVVSVGKVLQLTQVPTTVILLV